MFNKNDSDITKNHHRFKISAIVSTYNSEEFIRGCLHDLTEQTLYQKGELEIIIIDSNSRQNEREIVEEFQSNYPSIIYERTIETEPLYAAWNRAIFKSSGLYITNANTDDRHRFDTLEIMADYLDNHPDIGLAYADQLISIVANDTFATTSATRKWNWPAYSYDRLKQGCCIGSQPMWRKSLHDRFGYFREEFKCCGDYEFWLRIGSQGTQMAMIPEILGLYYFNPKGLEHGAPGRASQECDLICDEYNVPRLYVPQISGTERKFSDLQYQGIAITDEEKEHLDSIRTNYNRVSPRIAIDGVFFQLHSTGIARVWRSILAEWHKSGFDRHIVLIDRDNTAPKLPGIQYRNIQKYSYDKTGLDSQILQFVCDEVEADLFISTYYTTPTLTPSVFMTYDMIPEVIGADLQQPMWKEKHYGILHACRYIAISQSTADDLIRFFPAVDSASVTVAYCGVAGEIAPASATEIANFKSVHQIQKPYFLLVGSRMSLDGYKNATLFFKALKQSNLTKVAVVCIGGEKTLEPELVKLVARTPVHLLRLDDIELSAAYSGAIALVYPSLYEGFGLPIVEAMACGCPVIVCRNSSIPEVAGAAAIYVDEYRVEEMVTALQQVQISEVRQSLIERGFDRAKQFSWTKMAQIIADVLLLTTEEIKNRKTAQSSIVWPEFRRMQAQLQKQTSSAFPALTVDRSQPPLVNIQSDNLNEELTRLEIQLDERQQQLKAAKSVVASMQSTKFWKLRSVWFQLKPLLFPLTGLTIGTSLLILVHLKNLDGLVSWIARPQTNNFFEIGTNLIAIALILGIVGYLNYLDSSLLRKIRLFLIGSGLLLIVFKG